MVLARLLLGVSLCVALPAQVPYVTNWRAHTEIVTEAGVVDVGPSDRQTLPAGTRLGSQQTLRSVHPYGTGVLSSAYFSSDLVTNPDGSSTATLQEGVYGDKVLFAGRGYGMCGVHDTRLHIDPNRTCYGVLTITYETLVGDGSGPRNLFVDVDIGGDGSYEFHAVPWATTTARFEVVVPNAGLDVVTHTHSYVQAAQTGHNPSLHETRLTIHYQPPTATSWVRYGARNGLGISADYAFRGPVRDLVLGSNGVPLAVGAEVIGIQRASVPIPTTNCVLLNDAMMWLPFGYGADGSAAIVHSTPWNQGYALQVQLFALDPATGQLLCSRGIEVITP